MDWPKKYELVIYRQHVLPTKWLKPNCGSEEKIICADFHRQALAATRDPASETENCLVHEGVILEGQHLVPVPQHYAAANLLECWLAQVLEPQGW